MPRIDLFLLGYVKYRVPSERCAEIFEALRTRAASPRHIKRDRKQESVSFFCTVRHAKRLGDVDFRDAEITYGGLPCFCMRLLSRSGLVCGMVLALALVILAGLFVWDVQIQGNEEISREELVEELAASGLRAGSFLPRLDGENVALALRQGDRRVAYAGIHIRGTVAYVQVREAVLPKETVNKPANLIAKCDGVITLPLAFEGNCVVREGDAVRAGQLLVSGLIDSEKHGYRVTRAAGQIMARTVRTYTVHVPFAYTELCADGDRGVDLEVFFFGWRTKVFKSTGNIQGECDIIQDVKWLTLPGGRRVPVGIGINTVTAYTARPATRTAACARALAYEQLAKEMAADAGTRTLLERSIELQADAAGITLLCTVICEENIAVTAEFEVAEKTS